MAAFYRTPPPASLLVDPLCCHEEDPFPLWEGEEEEEGAEGQCGALQGGAFAAAAAAAGKALRDYWKEDEDGRDEGGVELAALLTKEAEGRLPGGVYPDADPSMCGVRLDAVRWLLKACARHGFNAQTALLAVAYLDRFLSSTRCGGARGVQLLQEQQPWMAQLSAVACLSLAAKMEETHVPLLLDLQMEEARYVFEATTVQRMELLVLSTLGWKMGNPTPLSFIDHFIRRGSPDAGDGLWLLPPPPSPPPSEIPYIVNTNDPPRRRRDHLHLRSKLRAGCHSVLLAVVADSRWLRFPPSVMAAAAMLRALDQLVGRQSDASSTMNLQSRLVDLLDITQDNVQDCTEFILDATAGGGGKNRAVGCTKRKQCSGDSPPSLAPPSPRGVGDATFSYDSRDHDPSLPAPPSTSTSVSSSPVVPPPRAPKKARPVGDDGEPVACQQPPPLPDGVFA